MHKVLVKAVRVNDLCSREAFCSRGQRWPPREAPALKGLAKKTEKLHRPGKWGGKREKSLRLRRI